RELQRLQGCLRHRPLEEQREGGAPPHRCLPARKQPSGVAWMDGVQGAVGGVHHQHVRHRLRLRILLPMWASPLGGAGPLAKALRRFPVVGHGTDRPPLWTYFTVSPESGRLRCPPPAGVSLPAPVSEFLSERAEAGKSGRARPRLAPWGP